MVMKTKFHSSKLLIHHSLRTTSRSQFKAFKTSGRRFNSDQSFHRSLLIGASSEPSRIMPDGAPSPSDQNAPPLVEAVYENQRWFPGIGWQKPVALLDFPPWTDAAASNGPPDSELIPLTMNVIPSEDTASWQLIINAGTDKEGWQYGTVYHHLSQKRPGGRSSQRFGDTVRRRLWRLISDNLKPASSPGGTTTQTAGGVLPAVPIARVQNRESESSMKAIRGFTGMVFDLLRRRKLWTLVPWDPTAVFVLYQKHQEQYQQLQIQAYQKQLFTADTQPPDSILKPGKGTLLQDMLCAAMHSRGAYGYAMAAGFIESIGSFVKLQTLQPLSFDAIGGVSTEANNEAVAQLAGIDTADILVSYWQNETYRPCHYVAIDRANQCIVLSIRGSLQIGDLLSNLTAMPMEVNLNGTDGGVAACLLMLIRQSGGLPGLGLIKCITMGGAAVLSESLAAECQDDVISVIVGSDVVPHLSYASVETLLLELSESSPVRQAATDLGKKLTTLGNGVSKNLQVAKFGELGLGGVIGRAIGLGRQPSSKSISNNNKNDDKNKDTKGTSNGTKTTSTGGRHIEEVKEGQCEEASGTWKSVKEASQNIARNNGGLSKILSIVKRGDQPIPFLRSPSPTPQQQAATHPRSIPIIDLNTKMEEESVPGGSPPGHIPVLDLNLKQETKNKQSQDAVDTEMTALDFGIVDSDSSAMDLEEEEAALFTCGVGADTVGMSSGLAQRAAQTQHAQQGGTGRDLVGVGGDGQPGPCNMYPPGTIVWIFPVDEHVNGVEGDKGESSSAAVPAVQKESEVELPTQVHVQEELNQDAPGIEPAKDSTKSTGKSGILDQTKTTVPGIDTLDQGEAVNMTEAAEQAEESQEKGQEQGLVAVPVAAIAERTSFERILLMPDMLIDHFPDRYLQAIQQL